MLKSKNRKNLKIDLTKKKIGQVRAFFFEPRFIHVDVEGKFLFKFKIFSSFAFLALFRNYLKTSIL